MSAPPAATYTALVNDLNRDVSRAQPADPLQFCADWFHAKLRDERAGRAASNLAVRRALNLPSFARSSSAPNPTANAFSFGGAPPLPSPFSEGVPENSPFAINGAARRASDNAAGADNGPDPSSLFANASPFGIALAEGDISPGAAAPRRDSGADETEDDVGSLPSPGLAPQSYNLGRRTSVSAESIQPHSSGAPKVVIPKTPSQRARIESSLSGNFLFRNLDEEQYLDVLNAMKEVRVPEGEWVIEQGAVGDFFYVVETGSLDVYTLLAPGADGADASVPRPPSAPEGGELKKVLTYGPADSFGELALMYNAPRAASVLATSPCTLWAVDRLTFRSILLEHTSAKRKMYEGFLAEVPLLGRLERDERAKIADALETRTFAPGQEVVRQGEPGREFFIIESGEAEVVKGGEKVGILRKGDYFGELALLNSAPRAATVRASSPASPSSPSTFSDPFSAGGGAGGAGKLRVATLGEAAFTRLLGPVVDIMARHAGEAY